jgi:hypothetical protein
MTVSPPCPAGEILPDLDAPCGRRWRYRDIVEVGVTWERLKPDNVPTRPETYEAIRTLCAELLDPVAEAFGMPTLTYGFASPALTRHIRSRIYPSLDQHAGCEPGRNGRPICPRLGQAVDLIVPGLCSGKLAVWIEENVQFDRLYFYGVGRPVHVSIGPERSASVVTMVAGPSGRLVPQRRKRGWLGVNFLG